jgi:hypothetical protein
LRTCVIKGASGDMGGAPPWMDDARAACSALATDFSEIILPEWFLVGDSRDPTLTIICCIRCTLHVYA